MRIYPRRYSHRLVAANSDLSLWGFPIPPKGTLNRLNFDTHLIGTEEISIVRGVMYGVGVWIIPIRDLESTLTLDVLWDNIVPKDEAETEGGFDLNEAADTQPEFAAGGELDWNSIFEISEGAPKEIYRRRKLVSVASNSTGYNHVDAGIDTWTPTDHFKGRMQQRHRVVGASMVVCGISSPIFDQTRAAAADVVPTEKQWLQLKFLDMTLNQALISAIGLIASGTQEPYSEALAWIAALLEPDILEDTGASFQDTIWNVLTVASADITVPDNNIAQQLSPE